MCTNTILELKRLKWRFKKIRMLKLQTDELTDKISESSTQKIKKKKQKKKD